MISYSKLKIYEIVWDDDKNRFWNVNCCLQVTCSDHAKEKGKVPQLRQGELVWAKHRNKRYYKGKIASIQDTRFYMVTFEDDSFSDDLFPEDIIVSFTSFEI